MQNFSEVMRYGMEQGGLAASDPGHAPQQSPDPCNGFLHHSVDAAHNGANPTRPGCAPRTLHRRPDCHAAGHANTANPPVVAVATPDPDICNKAYDGVVGEGQSGPPGCPVR